jgi:hypothetical protein
VTCADSSGAANVVFMFILSWLIPTVHPPEKGKPAPRLLEGRAGYGLLSRRLLTGRTSPYAELGIADILPGSE